MWKIVGSTDLDRHTDVIKIVHQKHTIKYNLVDRVVSHYKYLPDPVLENSCIKLYCDRDCFVRQKIEMSDAHRNRYTGVS